jgi:hypothetical protein
MAAALALLATTAGGDAINGSAGAGVGRCEHAPVILAQGSVTDDKNDPAVLIRSLLAGSREVRALRLRAPRVVMQREPRPEEFRDLDSGIVVSQPDRAVLAALFARLKPNPSLQSANPFIADYAFVFAEPDGAAYLLISTFTKGARLVGRNFPATVAFPVNLDPIFPQLKDALVRIVDQGEGR